MLTGPATQGQNTPQSTSSEITQDEATQTSTGADQTTGI